MRIDKIQTNKKEYLDMLLLADEQESMGHKTIGHNVVDGKNE